MENIKTEEVKSADNQIRPSSKVQVELFSSTTPEELSTRLLAKLGDSETDPRERAWLSSQLGIIEDTEREEIERRIGERIRRFSDRLEEIERILPEQQAAIKIYLETNAITPAQDIESISVHLYDSVLARVVPGSKYTSPTGSGQFIPNLNAIVLESNVPNWVYVHESAHAMSYIPSESECGWRKLNNNGLPEREGSNDWLDESCAMKLEFAASDHTLEDRQTDDVYYTYYRMCEVFQDQTGISDSLLLRAYFGDPVSRAEVDRTCQERYNCSIPELSNIMLGISEEWREKTLDLLRGKTVTIKDRLDRNNGLAEKYQKIARLFPNANFEISIKD